MERYFCALTAFAPTGLGHSRRNSNGSAPRPFIFIHSPLREKTLTNTPLALRQVFPSMSVTQKEAVYVGEHMVDFNHATGTWSEYVIILCFQLGEAHLDYPKELTF